MQPTNNRYALVIIGILFFVFGFVTWLNGTLIPFLKLVCELKTDVQAFFVTFAFYMAYFFLALPSSAILHKTGYKNGMALGLLIMAIGSLLFIPAANSRSFPLFLTGLFIQGTGLSLLQTASNPYISVMGPIESAAQRISIMGIANKAAGMLSPLILGALVLKNASEIQTKIETAGAGDARNALLQELSSRVITPYIIMAIILILLAFMIRKSSLPEIDMSTNEDRSPEKDRSSIFHFPHLWLGVLCIFLYVGVEVMAGDAIGIYGRELGMPLDETKYFTTFTLCAMLIGYIAGTFTIPKIISQQKALAISAVFGYPVHRWRLFDERLHGNNLHCIVRSCQCPYVAGHLPACDRWIGKVYKNRCGLTHYGNRGWRVDAFAVFMVEGPRNYFQPACFPCLHVAGLCVRIVLLTQGLSHWKIIALG